MRVHLRHAFLELVGSGEIAILILITSPPLPQGPGFVSRESTNDTLEQGPRVWKGTLAVT